MDNIWGQLKSSTSNSVISSPSSSSLTPDALIIHDLTTENAIKELIPEVAKIVVISDEMCIAAWELANYVPANLNENPRKIELWKNVIIPKITTSLVEDVKARVVVERSFSSIVNLANVINQGAGLVRATKGSPKAIEVARATITKQQEEVKTCIEIISKLQNSAISLFETHANDILEIIGPKASEFAQQEANYQEEINKLRKKAQTLVNKRAAAKATVEKYNNLCHAQSVMVNGAEAAMWETKDRTEFLQAMIKDGEDKINSIPSQIPVTTEEGKGFFRRTITTTSYVQNPDKQAQVDYYNGIILARTNRIKEQMRTATEVLQKQTEQLAEYKSNLERASSNLCEIDERICKELSTIDASIATLYKKIDAIHKDADDTESSVGLRGSVLVQCLTAIRTFAKTNKESCFYQPMVSVLTYILSLTEGPVYMLAGTNTDVVAGGVALLKHVGFLHETTSNLRQIHSPSKERQQVMSAVQNRGLIGGI